jgi:hypothetical protein
MVDAGPDGQACDQPRAIRAVDSSPWIMAETPTAGPAWFLYDVNRQAKLETARQRGDRSKAA